MQLMTAGEVAVQLSASPSTESSHCAGGAVPCHCSERVQKHARSRANRREVLTRGNKPPTRRLDAERRFTETAGVRRHGPRVPAVAHQRDRQ